jgi:hypothetical protein
MYLSNPELSSLKDYEQYNYFEIEWIISKVDSKDAAYINHYTLVSSENKFPHIGTYLKNTLEFYR